MYKYIMCINDESLDLFLSIIRETSRFETRKRSIHRILDY